MHPGPRCETDKGGPPTSRKIEPGDLLLLDFSVVVSGYRGDFTNTFAVGGGPTARQRELFEACLGAIAAGEARLKPGTPAREVDAAVRGHFASLGLDHAFTSHSGHGLGLGHPEPPYFVPDSDEPSSAATCVALEPGLYIEGRGGHAIRAELPDHGRRLRDTLESRAPDQDSTHERWLIIAIDGL